MGLEGAPTGGARLIEPTALAVEVCHGYLPWGWVAGAITARLGECRVVRTPPVYGVTSGR